MGKFAGFLKRLKNVARTVVNTGTKAFKLAKDTWNTFITKPGVKIVNELLPITKPITDTMFQIDNNVNKGITWLINRTNPTKNKQPAQIMPKVSGPMLDTVQQRVLNFNK